MIKVSSAVQSDTAGESLKVVSYNIHRCIGTDGSYNPNRIVAILHSIKADLIGLQEVDSRLSAGTGMSQLDYLGAMLNSKIIAGPCIHEENGHYGNALLTRLPVIDFRLIDLSVRGREPRGALDVDVNFKGRILRVIVTHLGCRGFERRDQIRRLVSFIKNDPKRTTVIMGDFNEWTPMSRGIRTINSHFGMTAALASFPSRFPVFCLDRIWVLKAVEKPTFHIEKSTLSRIASDHLPIVAKFSI